MPGSQRWTTGHENRRHNTTTAIPITTTVAGADAVANVPTVAQLECDTLELMQNRHVRCGSDETKYRRVGTACIATALTGQRW